MIIREKLEALFAHQPLRWVKDLVSAYVAYPVAEHMEKRIIRPKLAALRRHYQIPFTDRLQFARNRLADTLLFAQSHVPYYHDLFSKLSFNPEKVRQDAGFLQDLPYLTKDIIREQGARLHSMSVEDTRHHACKTGGSTGPSCAVYYDQEAADYSSAVTLYARERIGKWKHESELHFACLFPDVVDSNWPTREDLKCFVMNRSTIFFSRLDDIGLEKIWKTLKSRRPYLAHAHPSTIYALACYIERQYGSANAFEIFESSGELLEPYQREKISTVLQCRIVNRYGLAEFGVIGYELNDAKQDMQLLESEGWPESKSVVGDDTDEQELVFTSFRNRLMPLIRYQTGDLARVEQRPNGFFMTDVVGRIHDLVPINGIPHATHHIMDILDHRVSGIQEFQIDLRSVPPTLRIAPDQHEDTDKIRKKIKGFWGQGFNVQFVNANDFIRVGRHQKFRHLVHQ